MKKKWNHHWKRFNKRSIVTCHYMYKGAKLCSMYGRVIDTYVYQGVRFYSVKGCDSMFGNIYKDSPTYEFCGLMLEHTGRRVKSA